MSLSFYGPPTYFCLAGRLLLVGSGALAPPKLGSMPIIRGTGCIKLGIMSSSVKAARKIADIGLTQLYQQRLVNYTGM